VYAAVLQRARSFLIRHATYAVFYFVINNDSEQFWSLTSGQEGRSKQVWRWHAESDIGCIFLYPEVKRYRVIRNAVAKASYCKAWKEQTHSWESDRASMELYKRDFSFWLTELNISPQVGMPGLSNTFYADFHVCCKGVLISVLWSFGYNTVKSSSWISKFRKKIFPSIRL
jgi:hypothetical protein